MKPKLVKAPLKNTRDPQEKAFRSLLDAAQDVQETMVAENAMERICMRQLFKAITKAQGVL